jgi:electron transfer flavoprotein beta subunit
MTGAGDASGPLIVACLRWTDPHPDVDALTGAIGREAGRGQLSAADAAALEHALRIAGAWSGRVLAVCAGPPAADRMLRDAAALGAEILRVAWPPADAPHGDGLESDDAYVHDLATDERGLARTLVAALSGAGDPALVLCGDRSADRGTGALPAFVAHELGAAQALGLVALVSRGSELEGERRLDGGWRERLRIPCPAVCSVEASGVRLRRASLPDALAAGDRPVPVARGGPAPRGPGVRVGTVRPYRPRPRVVPPPADDDPRGRLLELTGALTTREPPTIVGPVATAEAADVLLAFLERHGYLGVPAHPGV